MSAGGFRPLGDITGARLNIQSTADSSSRKRKRNDSSNAASVGEYMKIELQSTLEQLSAVPVFRVLKDADLATAKPLTSGISGAKLIEISGKKYVLKQPVATETFAKNFDAQLSQIGNFQHRNIAESDDSFVHFPRKELVGSHLLARVLPDAPKAHLVSIEQAGEAPSYGVLIEFVKDATCMADLSAADMSPAFFHYEDSLACCLLQLVMENIDGHPGNLLTLPIEASDDDDDFDLATYRPVPIDFGLSLPRHKSLYPDEFNLVRKGLIKMFLDRRVSSGVLKAFNTDRSFLDDKEFQAISTPRERAILQRNFEAVERTIQHCLQGDKRYTLREFIELFLSNCVK